MLKEDVTALMQAETGAGDAVLIEDFFNVFGVDFEIPSNPFDLVEAFCVQENRFLDFSLQLSTDRPYGEDTSLQLSLVINGVVEAIAVSNLSVESSLSLIYRYPIIE